MRKIKRKEKDKIRKEENIEKRGKEKKYKIKGNKWWQMRWDWSLKLLQY